MPILAIVIVALQAYCVWHAYRNGNQQWVWVIIIAPGAGCGAYALAHVVPELFGSWGIRRTTRRVLELVDPKREQRALSANLERADTVENRSALGAEALRLKDFDQALALYQSCLTGMYATAPDFLLGVARAHFGRNDLAACKETMDLLIEKNPEFRSPDGHLMYARTLAGLGQIDPAISEFDALHETYPGEEARFVYAEYLLNLGRTERARELFEAIVQRARLAPKHYARVQSEWIQAAKAALNEIKKTTP